MKTIYAEQLKPLNSFIDQLQLVFSGWPYYSTLASFWIANKNGASLFRSRTAEQQYFQQTRLCENSIVERR